MAANYEIFKDQKKKFRFRLKAPNGEIIAASEAYNAKDSCIKGLNAVKKYAAKAGVKDLTE